ncbi:MAG: o-succinylbenzoate synthase [Paludibacteraceae bacterium]|nr:o-succinylbenzoate synthase [Paludibacteraceae bacterium]
MLNASYSRYVLKFNEPGGTSRGVMHEKETFFIRIQDEEHPDVVGIGECGLFRGLSVEDTPDYEKVLADCCWNFDAYEPDFRERFRNYPSILMGIETALADLLNGGKQQPFKSDFTEQKGEIQINGLVWMGTKAEMQERLEQKLRNGFRCVKLKIGAINFEDELELIRSIRERYSEQDVTIRVDANGGFSVEEAPACLEKLAKLGIHSIEQPIKAGQIDALTRLCANTPIPIALDEELIPILGKDEREQLVREVKPQFLVLKPTLHGGFSGAQEWIDAAEANGIGWWITSALESNVGLNAIAQWTYLKNNPLPQGLGTGGVFSNNLPAQLELVGDRLRYAPQLPEW